MPQQFAKQYQHPSVIALQHFLSVIQVAIIAHQCKLFAIRSVMFFLFLPSHARVRVHTCAAHTQSQAGRAGEASEERGEEKHNLHLLVQCLCHIAFALSIAMIIRQSLPELCPSSFKLAMASPADTDRPLLLPRMVRSAADSSTSEDTQNCRISTSSSGCSNNSNISVNASSVGNSGNACNINNDDGNCTKKYQWHS